MTTSGRPKGRKLTRGWSFLTVLMLVLAVWLTPALVGAWTDWTGIDPVIDVDGKQVSVYVEWPSEMTDEIEPLIPTTVTVNQGRNAYVVSESSEVIDDVLISTKTSLAYAPGLGKNVMVAVTVASDDDDVFPVRVHLSLDGQVVAIVEGVSNSPVIGTVYVP